MNAVENIHNIEFLANQMFVLEKLKQLRGVYYKNSLFCWKKGVRNSTFFFVINSSFIYVI